MRCACTEHEWLPGTSRLAFAQQIFSSTVDLYSCQGGIPEGCAAFYVLSFGDRHATSRSACEWLVEDLAVSVNGTGCSRSGPSPHNGQQNFCGHPLFHTYLGRRRQSFILGKCSCWPMRIYHRNIEKHLNKAQSTLKSLYSHQWKGWPFPGASLGRLLRVYALGS